MKHTIRTKADLQQIAIKEFFNAGLVNNDFNTLINAHFNLGKETIDSGLILSANAHIWGGLYPLLKFGTKEQQSIFIPSILSADIVTGHAITEPHAGSNVDGMTSTAEKVNKGFILNGLKRYITNAPIADWLIVYVKTNEGISAFLIARHDKGAEFITKNNLNAFKTSSIGDVHLNHCFIPEDRLIGKLGSGKSIMQSTLEHERIFLFAGIMGILEHHLEKLIRYCRQRKLSQGTLGTLQTINHRLATMRIQIDTIKRWLEYCALLKQNNKRINLASSQTKIVASEAFVSFCESAIQVMGAIGLEQDCGLSDLLLDAAACRLLSGSNEIQKNIIATLMGAT